MPIMVQRWSLVVLTILCGAWSTGETAAADPVLRSSPPASSTVPIDLNKVALQSPMLSPSAQSIGSYANGCIRGAQTLPPEGLGYQAVNL
ncbi:hypothetical protein [Azospirillum aestuarii]|uniref:hypothetical protein n=1 Tax=Azospirillum aestuarii TaxID=2802052 RepID=UPI004054DC43